MNLIVIAIAVVGAVGLIETPCGNAGRQLRRLRIRRM